MEYELHGIHTGDELKGVVFKSYPPVAKCEVQCSNRAFEGGQQTSVALSLKTGKNKPEACEVGRFCCKTFLRNPLKVGHIQYQLLFATVGGKSLFLCSAGRYQKISISVYCQHYTTVLRYTES